MELAAKELGPEAWLLNTRPAPPEAARPGEYEVVFGWEENGAECGTSVPADPLRAATPWEKLSREIAELRRELEETAAQAARLRRSAGAAGRAGEADGHIAALTDWGLSEAVAEEVLARLRARKDLGRSPRESGFGWVWDEERFERAAREELLSMLRTEQPNSGSDAAAAVALVGPPGAGKTTTLVKLAARFGAAARRPVQILSLDTYRIAAAEQLRTLAAILGAGFQTVETPRGLAQAMEEHRQKAWVLIDTPGVSWGDEDVERDLRMALAQRPEVEAHLVLPANLRLSDMERMVKRFLKLGARKLIFTHVDETDSAGGMISEAIRSGLPVAYLCDGQRIPEDLHEARAEELVARLFTRRAVGAAA